MRPRVPTFSEPTPNARGLALQVLLECRRGVAFAQEILDKHFATITVPSPERRLATQLVYGVLRRRATLDALLRPLVQRPPHRVEPWLWEAMRLGAYQLALLAHIPPYAAIHETVELAALLARPRAKGFLNGVLRAMAALVSPDEAPGPAADALPVENGTYRRLTRPALPDPVVHSVEYVAAGLSLPGWLVLRWQARYAWEECLRLGFWFAGPASLWLRVNTLRADRPTCLAAFAAAGIAAEAGTYPQAIRVTDSVAVRELPGYEQGWFAVQDESAMRVAAAVAAKPGDQVLDFCAAPGGKTTHLAELMANQGRIVACDVDEKRLETLTRLCERMGVAIVEARLLGDGNQEPPVGPFDAVLVDVPCSNTGVLGRRPEARWRLKPGDLNRLVVLQTKLLLKASERVRPGGAIVYSTCSIEPEENRQVVQAVLGGMPMLVLEADEEQVPGRPADGGYWARLRRKRL